MYLELAEAAASDRGRLASMLATRHRELSVPGADHAQLLNLTRRIGDVGRDGSLLRFLNDLEKSRWVAFYSSAPRCSQLARLFSNHCGTQLFWSQLTPKKMELYERSPDLKVGLPGLPWEQGRQDFPSSLAVKSFPLGLDKTSQPALIFVPQSCAPARRGLEPICGLHR
jgi:hypothetical protein